MPNFMLEYHGGTMPETPEEGAEHMAAWQAWADGLGDALINRGSPLGASKTVSSSGVVDTESNSLMGFSILKAESLDAAAELMVGSPHIGYGGTMVVSELFEM